MKANGTPATRGGTSAGSTTSKRSSISTSLICSIPTAACPSTSTVSTSSPTSTTASAARHDGVNQAVYNQKDKTEGVYQVGVYDIEKSQNPDIFPHPWQTDTSVGDWFYNVRDVYKTPKQIAEMMVDIVSKNGNLLLNIPQLPDGTIDDECTYLLEQTAAWMKANGEGIYGTRPWTVAGEGPSSVVIERFREDTVNVDGGGLPLHQQGQGRLRLPHEVARGRQDRRAQLRRRRDAAGHGCDHAGIRPRRLRADVPRSGRRSAGGEAD